MTDVSVIIEGSAVVGASAARLRRLQRLSAALAALAVGLAIVIVRLGTAGDARFRFELNLATLAAIGSVILFPLVGALIIQRRPTTRVAWLMLAMGIAIGIGFATYGYGAIGMPPREPLPGAMAALVASELFFVPTVATGTTLLLLLFPTDRLLDSRWRLVAVLSAVGAAAYLFGSMAQPAEIDPENFPGVANPIGLPPAWSGLTEVAVIGGNVALVGAAALAAVSLLRRYRRGDRIERAQIRWLALVGSLAAGAFAVAALQLDPLSQIAWELGFTFLACMPIAIGFAITRYRLYDIDRLINRTLVYGSLSAILAGVFTAGIGLAQRLFVATTGESSDAAIVLTTLVVATAYAPLRRRLESIVDRWFKYEHRRFGAYGDEIDRILGVLEPARAAERLVEEAIRELEATGGAVVDATGAPIAIGGDWPVPSVVRLPIPGAPRGLHAIVVGPRRDGRPHDPPTIARLEETTSLLARAIDLTKPNGPLGVGTDRG